ncbi:hypothetical protein TSOC_014564 [Tetrabaena socialis]|uniref:Uncharacterized protein n=1 Tax=Tetrabaena socialis TaxID=47790 RepID=A0A2J7ZHA0_9CHLO|nr:hypothetical protein TSOC_014564 [Tetrabaena socialis]|eukprot:PNG99653.1 hypothetical protein TSOC_014564 [Tetrabaena socialis]
MAETDTSTSTSYQFFRKSFHVPRKWAEDERIAYLTEHRYAKIESAMALTNITSKLKELGYMEDNNAMVHDYLDYMTQDLLDMNGEVYIIETELRDNETIKALLGGTTPDFIVKKSGSRAKTVILDVYVGDKQESEVKGKYKALAFFADFYVVTPHNFQKQLASVLPATDIDYLYKNFQIFLAEYYYWRACIKLQKVLVNDMPNIPMRVFPEISVQQQAAKDMYIKDLAVYATKVADCNDI